MTNETRGGKLPLSGRVVVKVVKESIEFNLSVHFLNSHDLHKPWILQ